MGSIVLKSLSILLGIFFIFVGTTKLTPVISKELHKDLRKEYVRYAKVFPLTEMLDFKVPSKWYRRTVGGLEIFFGLCLALIPSHKIKNAANIGLVLLMMLAAYSHVMVGDPFDRCAPALVFFFMLSGRLVVWYQTSRREALEKAATAQNGNGLKRD
ncbi:PREDICTED: transmembrane protein 35 [Papilio polytes]|uniref:transmembrane protein 35 n=1 Tax=Papilio polytes TaxID=76194 RepID=UPI000675F99E|nr:PREDICTED: transmembrane protein 35 [Papilio polytes]